MIQPETKYTRLGESCIAYQVVGDGPLDPVYVTGMAAQIDARWDFPPIVRWYERLSSFSRVILFDRRGSGASDPVPLNALPTWEEWAEDLGVVMDAVGSDRAAIYAEVDGGPAAMLFAATHPERTAALVLTNTFAQYVAGDGYEGVSSDVAEDLARMVEESWGTEDLMALGFPSLAGDANAMRWGARHMRASMSPRAASAHFRYLFGLDVRRALTMIRVPTLVLQRAGCVFVPAPLGRYVAGHIPGAHFVELPGRDGWFFVEGADEALDAIEEFLTGAHHVAEPDRVLATVLFTDIVGSTDRAAVLGDRRWRDLLDAHDCVARSRIESFSGRLVKNTGDGILATFDGPGRAIRCAFGLAAALREIGIDIRMGLHAGEVELRTDGDVGGIAVHIGARVMDQAGPGQIVCSRTVKDLVAGSEFCFEDRGVRALKGVPEEWQLFSVRQPQDAIRTRQPVGV
jgi:class 3 adenylate cyclase/pimeloyl-ACP methyl ester carboxylesterase